MESTTKEIKTKNNQIGKGEENEKTRFRVWGLNI